MQSSLLSLPTANRQPLSATTSRLVSVRLPSVTLLLLHAAGEFDEELDRLLHDGEVDDFAGGVHVAERNGEQATGDAAVGHLDGARIGASRTRFRADLVRDVDGFSGFDHLVVDDGVDVRAAGDDGSAGEGEATELTVVGIGVVGGVTDVDGDGDLWVDALGGDLRAARADLFLGGGHGDHAGSELLFLREATEGFHAHVGAGLIVKRAGHTDAAPEDFRAVGVDGWVADADDCKGVGAVVHADINPHVMTLRDALAVLGREQVDGALAGDAEHGAIAGEDVKAAAGGDDLVVAAEEFEVQVTLVVDMRDDQADLVDVAGEHQRGAAVALELRDAVAERVFGIFVGRLLHVVVDDLLGRELMAGRGFRLEQFLQEFRVAGELGGLFGHAGDLPLRDGKSSEGGAFAGGTVTR